MKIWTLFTGLAVAVTASAQIATKRLGRTQFGWEKVLLNSSLTTRNDETQSKKLGPYTIAVPIDHFQNVSRYEPHSDGFFDVTYYFDAQYYKPGGPVVLLATGEASAEDRLAFIQTGLLTQLAKATNGISVIFEHRYYGNSFPVPDLTVSNLRFLTTEQALADTAYFAQHVQFPGVKANVTSSNTPWFAYGGSYAGAFVAFLRKQYPQQFWGAISSSGVTRAVVDYWQYLDPIMDFGPQQCIHTAQKLTDAIDNVFESKNAHNIKMLRQSFGLDNVTLNEDVTTVLATPTGYWQNRNWDPAIDQTVFSLWCDQLTASSVQHKTVFNLTSTAQGLLRAGGYGSEIGNLTIPLVNWFGYVRSTAVASCNENSGPSNQDACFALNNPYQWSGTSTEDWVSRSWEWQVCTQWGYFISGSGRPKGNLGIISRLQTAPYLFKQCDLAFGITKLPAVEEVNGAWGGFDIDHSRLLFVGGQADPWREATPLAESRWTKGTTGSGKTTKGQTGYLIHTDDFGAVHHWDENGVAPAKYTKDFPPKPIRDVQSMEAAVIKGWVEDWQKCKNGTANGDVDC